MKAIRTINGMKYTFLQLLKALLGLSSDLPTADALNGTELVVVVQGGIAKQVSLQEIAVFATANTLSI